MNQHIHVSSLTIGSAIARFADAPVAEPEDFSRGRGILVMAPHPDDESLGCGGLIALACSRGTCVVVAVMTDGSGSHPGSATHSPKQLAQMREKELSGALKELAQPAPQTVFFRYTDGRMDQEGYRNDEVVRSLCDIVMENDIGSVFATWAEDPHPDHAATFELATHLVQLCPGTALFAYPIWGLTLPAETPLRHALGPCYRLNVSQMLERKRRAIGAHRSQLGQVIMDDPSGFQLQPDVLALFSGRFETFMEWKSRNNDTGPGISISSVDPEHFNALYSRTADPWSYVGGDYETHRYDTIISHLPDTKYKRGFELGCSIGVLTARLGLYCGEFLGGDCASTAVEAARLRTEAAGNITIMRMLAPDEMPEGNFDLLVLSEVLYFFSDADLARIASFASDRLEAGGTCVLVNYLGDTESPRTGDDAAETFMQQLGNRFMLASRHRETLFRLDVLQRQPDEVEP